MEIWISFWKLNIEFVDPNQIKLFYSTVDSTPSINKLTTHSSSFPISIYKYVCIVTTIQPPPTPLLHRNRLDFTTESSS